MTKIRKFGLNLKHDEIHNLNCAICNESRRRRPSKMTQMATIPKKSLHLCLSLFSTHSNETIVFLQNDDALSNNFPSTRFKL